MAGGAAATWIKLVVMTGGWSISKMQKEDKG